MATSYNEIVGRSVGRLEALSDGVFAFAMTLLVLDLRVPVISAVHSEHDLRHGLAALAPNALTYLLSFITLGIFWVGQHPQLNRIKNSDRNLTWIHLVFLLMVTLVPFSTKLLAAFITYRTALVVYWLNIVGLGATLYWSWAYVSKAGLVKDEDTLRVDFAVRRRILIVQALFAVGALLCLINTYVSIGFIILVQLDYVFAARIGLLRRL
jgi:uncharacterized membrane protein